MSFKRIIKRSIAIIVLISAVLVGGAWILVHTAPVSRFLLTKAVTRIEKGIGSKVHVGRMSVGWTHLSVELHDVVIGGREGPTEPPFFSAQRVSVQVEILPLFRKKLHFAFIRLDRPLIRFLIDRNGNSNIPHPGSSNPHSSTIKTLLNLEVRDFTLRSGELDLRDETIPLSAELHELQSQLKFDTGQQAYDGSIAYAHGTFSSGTLPATEHGLHANFTLTDSSLDLRPLSVNFGGSHFDATLRFTTSSPLHLAGNYQADIYSKDLSSGIGATLPIRGEFLTGGTLDYQSNVNATFTDSLSVAGEVRSHAVAVQYRQAASEIRDAYARYSLTRGTLRAWNVRGRALEGTIAANFEMPRLENHAQWSADASLQGANLSVLTRVAQTEYPTIQRVRPAGIANVTVTLNNGSAGTQLHALATIKNRSPEPARGTEIPVTGRIDVRYDSSKEIATFRQTSLEAGATRVNLAGTLSRTAHLNVQATTTDLHQLSEMATSVGLAFRSPRKSPRTPLTAAGFHGLDGAMQVKGTVSGRVQNPRVEGQLAAQNLKFDGTSWTSLDARFALSSSQAALQNGVLRNGAGAYANFDGQIGLHGWRLMPQSKILFRSSIRRLSIAEVGRISGKNYPMTGSLDATVAISGVKSSLSGSGEFQVSRASVWNQNVDSLKGKVQFAGQSVQLSAQAQIPAGTITAKFEYALNTRSFQGNVKAPALNLGRLHLAALQKFGVSGTLKTSMSGHGTIAQPFLSGSFELANFETRGIVISQVQAHFQLAGRHAAFSAKASEANTEASLSGETDLTGQYPLHAKLDVPSLSLGPLLASYSKTARQVQGQTSIHLSVDGPLKNPAAVRAHVDVPNLTLTYESVRLGLTRPLDIDYVNGVATVNPTELKGTGTDLNISGRIPVRNRAMSASFAMDGTVDLSALQTFSPSIQSSGQVRVHLSSGGNTGPFSSQFTGQVRVENASFFTPSSPVGLEKLNAVLLLSNERLDIKQFSAQIGGGTLTANGSIGLRHDAPFNIALQGNRIRIRYPQGIRSVLSANLQLNGNATASQLSGRVLLDQLSFTQQFDMATLMSGFSGNPGVPNASPFMRQMKLNVSLQSTREVQLASNQLSMNGSANLNIVGTAADPVILGRIGLTGGAVFFMGKRYEVQNGTISFANPARTEPVLDVYVQTTVRQYDITLNFVGPIDRLRTNYTSVPPLSPSDIINMLAFGKTTEEAAAAGSTPASVGAESVIAQGVGSQISGKLQNLTGLSQLTISPTVGGNQSGPGAQIGIQKQVTGNLLLTFSTDVTATQNTAVQLQYSATQHISVSVLRDQNGGYALDIRIRRSF